MNKNKSKKFYQAVKETILHFSWLLIFLIPLLGLINMLFIVTANTQRNGVEQSLRATASREITAIDLYINTKFDEIYNDLNVVNDANETQAYLDTPTPENFSEFQALLYRIANNKPDFVYTQFIDTNGDILFQTSRIDDVLTTSSTGLGNVIAASYYSTVFGLSEPSIYISKLAMKDDIPLVSFIKPLVHQNQIKGYYLIDYNVDSFLTIFGIYADENINYLSFGVLNSDRVWLANDTYDSIRPIINTSENSSILQLIDQGDEIVISVFDIILHPEEYVLDQDNVINIFIQYDLSLAISKTDHLLVNHLWIILVTNLAMIILTVYVAFLTRSKNTAQLQLSATTYLSSQNQNAVIIADHQLRFTYVNHAFERIYGYASDEVFLKSVPVTLQIKRLHPLFEFIRKHNYQVHHWDQTKAGVCILKYITIKQQSSLGSREKHYIGVFDEPHINLDHYIQYMVKQDMVVDILKHLLSIYPFVKRESTLIMIRFSHTDTYAFAAFLKSKLPKEYLVAIPDASHIMLYVHMLENQFEHMITKIEDLMDYYHYLPDTNKDFTHTFSIARADDQLNTYEALIDGAITALAATPHQHKLRHRMYTPDIKASVERNHFIYQALEQGFNQNEFYLHYQIQKNIKTNEFTGAEALLRWDNATLGRIRPDEFIPIIEDSYFINQLSTMVLKLAIKDLEEGLQLLPKSFRISINLSAFDLSNKYIVNQLIKTLRESRVPASRFTFEITESIYIDNIDETNQMLEKLHREGIQIAIDDFGTGYSSINSLQSINIDYVKTDRQFIMNYPEKDDAQMLKRMIKLIHSLHKPVVVEGTETEEQIAFCEKHRVKYVQGYLISKPTLFKSMIQTFIQNEKGNNASR